MGKREWGLSQTTNTKEKFSKQDTQWATELVNRGEINNPAKGGKCG